MRVTDCRCLPLIGVLHECHEGRWLPLIDVDGR